jgi:hypothetical protein
MKYSFLFPYYNRADCFALTLSSFKELYQSRNDYEVVIIEDFKNISNVGYHEKLKSIISIFNPFFPIKHIECDIQNMYNPSILFNLGAKGSLGAYLIVTNPECCHMVDILKGLDGEFEKNPLAYVVCSCLAVQLKTPRTNFEPCKIKMEDFTSVQWYQHTKHRNCSWHFCSCISKDTYFKFGGFDEQYAKGIAYDDVDFINTVRKSGSPVIPRDDLLTYHIAHDISYQSNGALMEINRKYYHNKWK